MLKQEALSFSWVVHNKTNDKFYSRYQPSIQCGDRIFKGMVNKSSKEACKKELVMNSLHGQLLGTCTHFTGIQNNSCESDIKYDRVMVYSETQTGRLPCFKDSGIDNCCARSFYTEEQVQKQIEDIHNLLTQVTKELSGHICPTCKQPFTKKRQIGRCVYAEPCGHRLYQGRV